MILPPIFPISAARAALCATWMIALIILWFTLTPQALPVAWMAPRSLWLLVPLALGFGGAIELLQPYVGRSR